MNRIQPFYYIVALAGIFVLTGLALFLLQFFAPSAGSGVTIDPQAQNREDALYDLWFSSTTIYDLSVDQELSGILFSAGDNIVSLLDQERRLRWEKVFATQPVQAKLSSCGRYIVVGTVGGRLFFSSVADQSWWEHEGAPIRLIALSPSASWIAVYRVDEENLLHQIELYSQDGELKWVYETAPVKNLYLTSEHLDQGNIFFTALEDERSVVTALDLQGDEMWQMENFSLAAVTSFGTRLAVVDRGTIVVCDSLGYQLWRAVLPFDVSQVQFNNQNYNRLLVYGSSEGAADNFYYFDMADDLLWSRRIADGSLFSFSGNGQHIITGSWRHYKDDYTQMFVLDNEGNDLNSWEVAMRVERLVVAANSRYLVLSGHDGYIDLIDLEEMLNGELNGPMAGPIYNPVAAGERPGVTTITLYFTAESGELLPITRTINQTETPLRAALDELIRGPARGSYLYRTIPDKDAFIETEYDPGSGVVSLELSEELVNISGTSQARDALLALIFTISAYDWVDEIYLTFLQEPLESLGEGLLLEQPLNPVAVQQPVYAPVRSGERYYLAVREGQSDPEEEQSLRALLAESIESCRLLSFVPDDLTLVFLNDTPEEVRLVLNEAFIELFPEEPRKDDYLQAALVLDALFLTIFENSRTQRAVVSVEGPEWSPPPGYPSLSRFLRQPYYVNPE